ncbi:hypothetical protein IPG41_01330 [Candidatus Peregrinibacteria bacterium]|nr:MAG: hypothetical protein IPG41_01330 [Candidatus Peregrinibacteria bacterium]
MPEEFLSESARLYYDHLGGAENPKLKRIIDSFRKSNGGNDPVRSTIRSLHPALPFAGRFSSALCDPTWGTELDPKSQEPSIKAQISIFSSADELEDRFCMPTHPVRCQISLPQLPDYPFFVNRTFCNLPDLCGFAQNLNAGFQSAVESAVESAVSKFGVVPYVEQRHWEYDRNSRSFTGWPSPEVLRELLKKDSLQKVK